MKGIVLAKGDYSYNKDMIEKYFPGANLRQGLIPTSMGEGHQMAMWIGAQMEKTPHARDLDFGKRPDRLTAVDTPPFYAHWNANPDNPMLIFGGLICNERLQPLDANGKAIPGLYLAGNTVGGCFKYAYPLLCPGISHGMAMTTGYLAGRFAFGLS